MQWSLSRKDLVWLLNPRWYLQDMHLGKASLFLLVTWQNVSGNPEKQATGSPTICLSATFSEVELHFKVSLVQPFTLQSMCPSLKYQIIFSYPHNIAIRHALLEIINRTFLLPTFKYLPLFLLYCPFSNLEIIFHNWPPTTYCFPVILLTLVYLMDWSIMLSTLLMTYRLPGICHRLAFVL